MTITMIKLVVVFMLIGIVAITGCKRHHIHICDPDEEQCITVIDPAYRDFRYIIIGRHETVPDSNYAKLKLGKTVRHYDGISICWDNYVHNLEIVIPRTEIIEDHLNMNGVVLKTQFDKDEHGLPITDKYRSDDCANISLYDGLRDEYTVIPNGNAVVFDMK